MIKKTKQNKSHKNMYKIAGTLPESWKKLWYMKVTGIIIIVGTLKTIPKNLEKKQGLLDIWGRIKTYIPQHNWNLLEYLQES